MSPMRKRELLTEEGGGGWRGGGGGGLVYVLTVYWFWLRVWGGGGMGRVKRGVKAVSLSRGPVWQTLVPQFRGLGSTPRECKKGGD